METFISLTKEAGVIVHTLSTFGCTFLFSYEGREQGCTNLGQSKPKFSSINCKSLLLLVILQV